MRNVLAVVWFVVAGLLVRPGIAAGASPQEVDAAVQKARAYLYSVRGDDGTWEGLGAATTGAGTRMSATSPAATGAAASLERGLVTAEAVEALIASVEGFDPHVQEPGKLKGALDYLLIDQAAGSLSYEALDARLEALSVLGSKTPQQEPGPRELRDAVMNDGKYLLERLPKKGDAAGLYSSPGGGQGAFDIAASAAATRAMDACIMMGYRIPEGRAYWLTVERAWEQQQQPDGGWIAGGKSGASMQATLSALNGLFMAQDYAQSDTWLHPAGNPATPHTDQGVQWVGQHFGEIFEGKASEGGAAYLNLVALDELGRLSGRKYLGTHDWYGEASDWLVRQQHADGSFGQESDLHGTNLRCTRTTALALLFMAKARGPILINKLAYDVTVDGRVTPGHWNQRPGDVATLVRWAARNEYRPLNWQIVNLKDSSAEDLHQAPILYLAGDQALSFTPEEKGKLKRYVEQGGLIFANPDGIEDAYNFNYPFASSYFALVHDLFPQYLPKAEGPMVELPANHFYYTIEQFRHNDIVHKNLILATDNGVRNLMEFIRVDYAKRWQGRMYIKTDEWRNMSNLYMFETSGENIRHKSATALPVANSAVAARQTVRVGRLQYDGNYDPEPAGWANLAAFMHNSYATELAVSTVRLGDKSLKDCSVVHITGTGKFSMTPEQRAEVRAYLDGGGTLLIDAAGNSARFTDSMQWELVSMFGAEAAQLAEPIDAADAIYKGTGPLSVQCRPYARSVGKDFHFPQIRGIKIGRRWAVLFSREDLSSGIAGVCTDGLATYSPASATEVLARVLHSLAAAAAQ